MKVGQRSLLGYLPAQVIKCVLDGRIRQKQDYPVEYNMNTVALYAELNGITKSDKLSKYGIKNPEFISFCFNRFMELLINIIGKNGGDIIKFVGDALMVIWPSIDDNEEKNDLQESCIRAFQCAKQITKKMTKLNKEGGMNLGLKIGLGVGECRIFFAGGTFSRSEFLIVGSAMKQACTSILQAKDGEIIISDKVYELIHKRFPFSKKGEKSKFYVYLPNEDKNSIKLQLRADAFLMRTKFSPDKLADNMNILRTFVPSAITNYLDIEMENWCKEIRLLTIMFVKLPLSLKDTENLEGKEKIQNVVLTVQRGIYRTRGSLNKLIMNDSESVMLCCWGLPPFSSAEDPVRAILSGNCILKELSNNFKINASIGIATGRCFTGVCGSVGGRKEYSLLGDIVNFSSDLMSMGKNPDMKLNFPFEGKNRNMNICENTKNLIQNKIFCEMHSTINKNDTTSIEYYTPIDSNDENKDKKISLESLYQLIKTHRNNRISENDPSYEIDNNNDSGIGLEYEKGEINKRYNKMINTKESQAILITGMIGSGKSLLLRSQISYIIRKSDNSFLNNMSKILFISNQNPITHTVPMNGFQEGMKTMFKELLKIKEETRKIYKIHDDVFVEGDAIFGMIFATDNFKNIRYIEEILGHNMEEHYTVFVTDESKIPEVENEIRSLELNGDPFFFVRDYEHNKTEVSCFFLLLMMKYQKHVLKDKPLIYIVEDCQQLDSLSVEFIKQVLDQIKNGKIENIFLLCTFQSLICGIKDYEKEKYLKFNKELEDSFENGTIIQMKPFIKSEDVAELIKENIVRVGKTKNSKDGYEKITIDEVPIDVINALLPLSFKGNPLFIIELTQALLDQKFLTLKNRSCLMLTEEFKKMLKLKDYSKLKIPLIIEKVLGNIIDSLKCMEIIILKHASVIGNIFDIDILSEILSTSPANFDDLIDTMRNFESYGIIEILYDLKPKHLVAMFALPLMREVLYQRMLVEQKTDIHAKIARKMEFSKFSYMPKNIEHDILKKHLETSEQTIMNTIDIEENDASNKDNFNGNITNQKILVTKDIIEKLKIVDLKIASSYSLIKKQFMPMLLSTHISKKDEHGGKVEERYAVLTNKKLCYYYDESNYNDNKEPLASFFLKDIYQITIVSKELFDEKKSYYLEIKVSSWFKKSELKEDRNFIIGFESQEEMLKWEIALNFLRIKNMYDEFTSNFGMIQLPLNNEIIIVENKRFKRKLNLTENKLGNHNRIIKKSINNTSNDNSLIQEQDENEAMNKLKFDAQYIFEDGFGYFLAILQIIIKKGKNDIENENIHYNKKDRTKNNYHDRINDD
jgi:adenylate cyclase 10